MVQPLWKRVSSKVNGMHPSFDPVIPTLRDRSQRNLLIPTGESKIKVTMVLFLVTKKKKKMELPPKCSIGHGYLACEILHDKESELIIERINIDYRRLQKE